MLFFLLLFAGLALKHPPLGFQLSLLQFLKSRMLCLLGSKL